jgi:hypothetical protein
MEIVYDEPTLNAYIDRATEISPDHPVLVDRFLDDAIEIDVDALCDATGEVYLGGVMEHIEEAGIHSGDSACSLPPVTLAGPHLAEVRRYTEAIARGVGVRGLLNVQYALKDDDLYVLEANPRASRTVPFVSKATAVPLAKAAARIMLGATIAELRAEGVLRSTGDGGSTPPDAPIAIKEAVLPFKRFRTPGGLGVDSLLGPEMKSTGEVMGIDTGFGQAYAKSQAAAYGSLPTTGKIFVSVANRDKRAMIFPIKRLADLGFTIVTTAERGGAAPARHRVRGGAEALRKSGQQRDRAHRRGRDRAHHQHPTGLRRQRPLRRVRAAQRRVNRRHPEHHHHPGRRGRGHGHRGADARRHGGPARCRSCTRRCGARRDGVRVRRPAGPVPAGRRRSRAGARVHAAPARRTRSGCAGGAAPGVRRAPAGRGVRRDVPERRGARGGDGQGRRGPAGLARDGVRLRRVGTVTARAQPGNPKPRLFRLPDSAAVINRMGFNNAGAAALAARLEALGRSTCRSASRSASPRRPRWRRRSTTT